MTLADKIIMLRKKQGWSQDELAQKLDVTRQSVSKWESAQSVPDVCKIVQISELFGVTTDYLLKDNEEGEDALKNEQTEPVKEKYPESDDNLKKISKEDADEYISLHKEKRGKMALASLLCVLSPICLFIMLAYGSAVSLSESTMGLATMIGIAGILIFVAIAVTMFISADAKTKKFEYIEKDPITLTDEARKLVETEKTAFTSIYTKYNIIGTLCCIFAAIPLLIGSIYGEMVVFLCLCCLLACVAIGVYFFVFAGVLFVHKRSFKLQTEVVVFVLFDFNPVLAFFTDEREGYFCIGKVKTVIKDVVNFVSVNGNEGITAFNFLFFSNGVRQNARNFNHFSFPFR